MRKLYIDNIRWITVVLVVLYHVIYMFNGIETFGVIGPFSDVQYQDAFQYIVYPWFMLLLFAVSGMSARYELFYPQLGVKLCSMAGGGVQKIYMVLLREPSRRDRSGSDLFHLRDGFEIKMNFDRNVSCFIFVNALMHDDFFD